MEYHTPGVYIREVDSGPKPIASVATSIPGFLGLFEFRAPNDAVAITGSNGKRQIRGKLPPALVDEKGAVKGDAGETTTALTQAFKLSRKDVRDVKKYFELFGAPKAGPGAPKFEAGTKGKVKVSLGEKSVELPEMHLSVEGRSKESTKDHLVVRKFGRVMVHYPIKPTELANSADVGGLFGH